MRRSSCKIKVAALSCRKRPLRKPLQPSPFSHDASYSTTRKFAGRPFRLAIIGSGPAGFYSAYRVMSKLQPGEARVDMYEALPVPFGLVRFGVAPDHPEVKNCQDKFNEVAESKYFRFIGNTAVGAPFHQGGQSVALRTLAKQYDAILFAYGASKDKTLGVEGENLKGIHSAREFVGWYNGLPEHADLNPDLTAGEEAVIIGQGNVALDVARILLEDVDNLRKTDIAEHALETLSKSKIKRVHVVGRRGPMQAAFTIKEARELIKLPNTIFTPIDKTLIPSPLTRLERPTKRLMELLLKGSQPLDPQDESIFGPPKTWSLDFCLSPKRFTPSPSNPARVGATVLNHTTLSSTFDPGATALRPQNRPPPVTIPTAIAFRSIGYKAEPLPGMHELGVPFDEGRGTLAHDGTGRVRYSPSIPVRMSPATHPRLYCAGWVKRGPTGVIASTMADAFETGDAIVEDWVAGKEGRRVMEVKDGWGGVRGEARLEDVVGWEEWREIDRAEVERGGEVGRPRLKFTRVEDMLDAAFRRQKGEQEVETEAHEGGDVGGEAPAAEGRAGEEKDLIAEMMKKRV